MKPYAQLIKHDPKNGQYGDCGRTAIACLLERPPEQVPHFLHDGCEDGNIFWGRVNDFLKSLNLHAIGIAFDDDPKNVMLTMKTLNPGVYYMLGGASPVADHMVIAKDGEIVHDPAGHPVDSFTRGGDGYVWVHFFVPLFLVDPLC